MLLPILIGHFHDEGIGQQLSEFFFAFLFKFVKPIRHFYISHNAPYFPLPQKKICVSIAFSRFFRPVSTFPESFASVQPVLIITVF